MRSLGSHLQDLEPSEVRGWRARIWIGWWNQEELTFRDSQASARQPQPQAMSATASKGKSGPLRSGLRKDSSRPLTEADRQLTHCSQLVP